ncbi:MAG: ABC transporter ATP-binding protein [Clostridiales bacterium]|nr:ABC transporter ATP-binding protein [Clostridiales bacterium]
MELLKIDHLKKRYSSFELNDISFSLESGYIMGFIGPNGAGKTTTLKCMLGLTPKDGGSVQLFGQDFFQNELAFKQHIGVSFGGVDFYAKTRIRTITDVVRRFYDNWDDSAYRSYMARFHLDEAKRPSELSGGMKIKYALALAMSHHAKLLILDEPTSGLDPVARDDLLTLFQELIETGDVSILFSTHITSDLEKCADFITYIENGRMIASCEKDELIASYRIVKGTAAQRPDIEARLVSAKTHAYGFTGLIRTKDLTDRDAVTVEAPSLEDIMIYHAREEHQHEKSAE